MAFQFPPLLDTERFPVLTNPPEILSVALMTCDDLTLFAPEDEVAAISVTKLPGVEWHQYGDTRWPSRSTWIEFPLANYAPLERGGVLILVAQVPKNTPHAFEWIASNHPLGQSDSAFRAESYVSEMAKRLNAQARSKEIIEGPETQDPAYVQSYCIYQRGRSKGEVRFVAHYTDLLNFEGVPIPRFRTAGVQAQDIELCRFSLHAVFRLNQARTSGFQFATFKQLPSFEPVLNQEGEVPPKWSSFHPSRTLRSRPAVRELEPPKLVNGILGLSDLKKVTTARRREANAHMFAFDREARPRDAGLMNTDTNATLAAYIHRANGGAIYVLPDSLVEEFDHTDCGEVRVADLTLPFPDLFLRFTSPQPLTLGDQAFVDGCYIIRQGDEILFTLTSRLAGVDYQNSISVACVDPLFSLHLPASDPEMTVNEAVELGINAFLATNAPPQDDKSETITRPDGAVSHIVDVRAQSRKRRIEVFRTQEPSFRACLNIIVNAVCFITFRPDDISDAWEGQPPDDLLTDATAHTGTRKSRERREGALLKIQRGDFTRIKICGRDLFTDPDRQEGAGDGASPRAHWRRGHWRKQKHGVGLSLTVLRWIRPTIVKRENGPLVEARIYEV